MEPAAELTALYQRIRSGKIERTQLDKPPLKSALTGNSTKSILDATRDFVYQDWLTAPNLAAGFQHQGPLIGLVGRPSWT